MNKFVFNNRDSFEDMDCIIVAPIQFPTIREEVENILVEGRKTGTLTRKTGNYADTIIDIKMQLNDMEDYKVKMFKISEWLENIKNNRLIFDNYPGKCYIVKDIKLNNFVNEKVFYSRFDIQFICEPFMRARNERFEIVSIGSNIINNGDIASEPLIKLKLPPTLQPIQILINDNAFQMESVSGTIEIDSQLQRISSNKPRIKTIGKFPILDKGVNFIEWYGNIDSFEINKRIYYKG